VRSPRAAVLLAIFLVAAPRAARANMAQAYFEGDRSSILVPDGATKVRVDHEELSFLLRDLATAEVTASYHLTNTGSAVEADDVAFAFVRGEHAEGEAEPRASIEADGAPVSFRALSDPDVAGRWSTLRGPSGGEGVGLLLFHLDFAPGQTRSVIVRYDARADVDEKTNLNSTYGFDYLLSPARRWAGFGPLDISVRVPERASFASPLPFQRDGDTYRAHFAGLPEGELRFETTSLDGVWLGMTGHGGYEAILLAAVAATAIAVSTRVGRLWAGARGWKRALLPLFVGGPLASACCIPVVALLCAIFPDRALGFGYAAGVGAILMVLLAGPIGVAASAVAAARRSRIARALTNLPPEPDTSDR
jgi:hypothetical protein